MTSKEVRQSFLDYFEQRGHRIVPSSQVIPHGDPTLLFTNAGMNQFKDVFLGTGKREYVRAADTQKCIRVSGKHNDLEEVGRDTYHHTFFEMLGNWSFGDYYKKEAIEWAWDLLTRVWGLEKKRLYATVFETDDEAADLWRTVTDIDPAHIQKFGKKDNFWEMGETGPCGPCSEIHIDLTPDYSGGHLVNAGDARVMEIWNLVFIQNNRNEKGELENLPAKHVDTGMGFERVCAVLQGKKSNYDTDVFMPIISAIANTVGRPYTGELDSPTDIAMRVIADHIRMLTFSIADGAIPGNEGRGYVLRRILRRAARFGRNLGMQEPFICTITGPVVDSMGKAFPEIVQKRSHIERVIKAEEEGFNATLDRGLEIFESVASRVVSAGVFPGEDAFKLYDTYGFPLDMTEMMARERGLEVDRKRFEHLMAGQRERSRTREFVAAESIDIPDHSGTQNEFVGYSRFETDTEIAGTHDNYIILRHTPFYAESGGQLGDTGVIIPDGSSPAVRVLNTRKSSGVNVSVLDVRHGFQTGQKVRAVIDLPRRRNIQRNHSATHIVHEALRRVLGTHVHQQGSLVAPDHLRFDFPHFGKITPEEIRAIEDIVNGKIAEDVSVFTEVDMPIEQAKKIPNVKMFFGDKYGDIVRVVFIDEKFSVEFCGGTHVKNTQDIGLFKIISESGIASGVRRIEARTGEGILRYIEEQKTRADGLNAEMERLIVETEALQKELGRHTEQATGEHKRTAFGSIILPSDPAEAISTVAAHISGREQAVEEATKLAADLRKELSRQKVQEASGGIEGLVANALSLNGFRVVSSKIDASTMDELKSVGDTLRSRLGSGVGVLASVIGEKVALVCVVTDDLIQSKGLQAGKIVGELAKNVGGGGGGKPHLATAGGKDVAKLDETLRGTLDLVHRMLEK